MRHRARDLIYWQTAALGEALWRHEQGLVAFENLEPALPLEKKGGGVYDPASGRFDTEIKAMGLPGSQRPSCLSVEVEELLSVSIPQHNVYLMASDHDAAVKTMTPEERAAWFEYVGKPRFSSLYTYKEVKRKRVPKIVDGEPVSQPARLHRYVVPGDTLNPALERAARKMLTLCDRPSKEHLEMLLAPDLEGKAA